MDDPVTLSIDISRACQISGWMNIADLEWLASQARVNHRIIELGSFLGRSSRALCDNTDGKVLCIDHWHGPDDVEVAGREHLYEEFILHLGDRVHDGVCVPWNINHRDITPALIRAKLNDVWNGDFPDMIFIDGAHDYKAVYHDISTWLPFLGSDGLLAGHDYNYNYPGLLRAVLELIPNPMPAPGTDIFYWVKP
jgi:hypothetical protein